MKVLGISGSLRNARFGAGSDVLVKEIRGIKDAENLRCYLKQQTRIRADDLIKAGKKEGLPFDIIYRNLQKAKGDKGLSNSEASLVAGLWGAVQEGADISHVGLSQYFPMNGSTVNLKELKRTILQADALLISGPVYFGDRGSLVQSFVEFITDDEVLTKHLFGKLYAGIAVGAKRNGGQETQLIYQLIDMNNLGMLSVGNSAETTSQYGGTVVAGDVGTAWSDDYGLNTSVGTGQRLAQIAMAQDRVQRSSLKLAGPIKIGIWLVQDNDKQLGLKYIEKFTKNLKLNVEIKILDLTKEEVYRCIGCDLCPTHHAPREEYACIIKSKDDFFVKNHEELVDVDAILLAAYSPVNRETTHSVYQKFIERTRYIRRADYGLTDRLVAPLVITELNANQNLHIRMLTSLIRHHTILHHPIIGVEHQGKLINSEFAIQQLDNFVERAIEMTIARLTKDVEDLESHYNPVGYEISAERNREDKISGRLLEILNETEETFLVEKAKRLLPKENT